jgi:UDP-GlcNAc:undecaprenyl-phosphate/decaprenyl-phosphate GlcNAc-1-phosphate transferase
MVCGIRLRGGPPSFDQARRDPRFHLSRAWFPCRVAPPQTRSFRCHAGERVTLPLLAPALAALVSAVTCGVIWYCTPRLGALVTPRADRWHSVARPHLGGVGIALGLAAGTTLGGWPSLETTAIAVAGLLMFVTGLADDRFTLSPQAKLVASLACGAIVVYLLTAATDLRPPAWLTLASIVWFGGITHALNLLDNMDGLAGGTALLAAVAFMALFADVLTPTSLVLLASLAAALVGFLVWNVHPAKLFMGDSGSLLLGAVLATVAIAVVLQPAEPILASAFVAGLVLTVPLFDTGFVLVLRRLAGRPATRGGTDHVSHRLVSLGFSQWRAVAGLWLLGAFGGGLAYLVRTEGGTAMLPLVGAFVAAVTVLGVYLARVPAYDGEDFAALQKGRLAPFVRDLTFRWHAAEVLLDSILITAAYYASYRLRFEDEALDLFLPAFTASLPIVIACKLGAQYVTGLYTRMWITFGLRDLSTVVRGVVLGSVLSVLAVSYIYRFEGFSRGVFIIDGALLLLAILASRASFRLLSTAAASRRADARRVMIYGAGDRGLLLAREMLANPDWQMNPVSFLDDDSGKWHRRLLGIPVRGDLSRLGEVLRQQRVDEVVISSDAVDEAKEAAVRAICHEANVPVRRLFLEIR